MPKEILKEEPLTIAEAKEILNKVDKESLGEFQRRVLDYSQKISKLSGKNAKKLMKKLIGEHKLTQNEAIQIVNAMPETMEEIRSILAIKGRTFESEFFDEVLKSLGKFRKK